MTTDRFSIHAYTLAPGRHGALVRLESNGAFGYGDLHPWPEFGDPKLLDELKALVAGAPLKLGARTLGFARRDLEARVKGESLFDGLEVPVSHYTVTDVTVLTKTELDRIWDEGFRTLKMKVARNIEAEVLKLSELVEAIFRFQLRFDFSERCNVQGVRNFMARLDSRIRKAIEFVEDPVPYKPEDWKVLRTEKPLTLALDRHVSLSAPADTRDWLVLKPAREDAIAYHEVKDAKLCVTSSLDHPVGQMCAALEAAELARLTSVGTCGLLSHVAYEANDFSSALRHENGRLLPFYEDVGLGFSTLLERLEWRAISPK